MPRPSARRAASRPAPRTRAAACLAAGLAWAALAPGAELLTPEGRWVRGDARAADGTVTVGGTSVALDDLLALRFSERADWRSMDQSAVFGDGQLLAGRVETVQGIRIRFTSDVLGETALRTTSVQALVMQPHDIDELPAMTQGVPGAVLINGDLVAGRIAFINRTNVGVHTGRKIQQVPRDRVRLVRFRRAFRRAANPNSRLARLPKQHVRLVSGDRLIGRLVSLDAKQLVLNTGVAGAVTLPTAKIYEVWTEGGNVIPVSTLKPVRVRQIPQFDEHFPHKLDRSQAGTVLSIGGRRYDRGIGCHSRCELSYDLGGAYRAFVAEVGIDDGVGRRGEVVFRVLVDGERKYDSGTVRGGEPSRVVSVPLAGAKRMTLVVDFGPDEEGTGDQADWARATLLRKPNDKP